MRLAWVDTPCLPPSVRTDFRILLPWSLSQQRACQPACQDVVLLVRCCSASCLFWAPPLCLCACVSAATHACSGLCGLLSLVS